ncbi:hypothetical protein Dimus_010963, partial [Dionaea muscipula]
LMRILITFSCTEFSWHIWVALCRWWSFVWIMSGSIGEMFDCGLGMKVRKRLKLMWHATFCAMAPWVSPGSGLQPLFSAEAFARLLRCWARAARAHAFPAIGTHTWGISVVGALNQISSCENSSATLVPGGIDCRVEQFSGVGFLLIHELGGLSFGVVCC